MEGSLAMKKALARLTYPLRQKMSSSGTRNVPRTSSIDGLEADIRQLQAGWSQHIPKILDAISVSEHDAKASDDIHARIDALRHDLDRLSDRLNASCVVIEERLSELEAASRR